MEWYYQGKPIEFGEGELDPKKIYGFVYVIRNLLNGRKYIGKKFFWSKRTMVRKGKKLKSTIESDWRKYCGSNGPLLEDIKEFGAQNFEKEIIHLCASKSECAYLEAKEQFALDAILDANFYNDWISVKTTRRHLMKFIQKKNVQIPEIVVE